MFIKHKPNNFGTMVTVFWCDVCGDEYTVCPAVPDDKIDDWNTCQARACGSYDVSRDADKFFDKLKFELRVVN